MEGATALAASGRIASTIGTISFVSFVFILRFLVAGPSGGILLVVVVSRLGHHLIGERFRHAPNLFFFILVFAGPYRRNPFASLIAARMMSARSGGDFCGSIAASVSSQSYLCISVNR